MDTRMPNRKLYSFCKIIQSNQDGLINRLMVYLICYLILSRLIAYKKIKLSNGKPYFFIGSCIYGSGR